MGDHYQSTGESYVVSPARDVSRVGVLNETMLWTLIHELTRRELIQDLSEVKQLGPRPGRVGEAPPIGLTLDGWDRYEAERRGRFAGRYGFIAMKFGDPDLDPFIETAVKPIVKAKIGYDLIDLRDVSQAGVIDNLMRQQIRDAAFVLADLTHDNSGAYWEAGYAEGLGKPVIYLCRRAKFDLAKTHFDTNHCTTVLWDEENRESFQKELVATLRRSLDLFPNGSE
jgi:nucleoside 2-deoxyribosyltransferase